MRDTFCQFPSCRTPPTPPRRPLWTGPQAVRRLSRRVSAQTEPMGCPKWCRPPPHLPCFPVPAALAVHGRLSGAPLACHATHHTSAPPPVSGATGRARLSPMHLCAASARTVPKSASPAPPSTPRDQQVACRVATGLSGPPVWHHPAHALPPRHATWPGLQAARGKTHPTKRCSCVCWIEWHRSRFLVLSRSSTRCHTLTWQARRNPAHPSTSYPTPLGEAPAPGEPAPPRHNPPN